MTNEQIFKLAPIGSELPVLGKVLMYDETSKSQPVRVQSPGTNWNLWPSRDSIIEAIQIKGLQDVLSRNSEGLLSFPLTIEKLLEAAPIGTELYGLGKVLEHDSKDVSKPLSVRNRDDFIAWPNLMDIINAIFLTKYPQFRPDQSECSKDPKDATTVPMESPSPEFTTADGFVVLPGEEVWDEERKAFGSLIYYQGYGDWAVSVSGCIMEFITKPHSKRIYKHKPAQTKTIKVPAEGLTTEWFIEKFPIGLDLGEDYGKVIQHHPNDIDEPIETVDDYLNPFQLINFYITKPELFTPKSMAEDEE